MKNKTRSHTLMPTYAHRPTWPERAEIDRVVIYDGEVIGRAMQHQAGPQQGLWQWSGCWPGMGAKVTSPGTRFVAGVAANSGLCETLDEALDAIKREHVRCGQPDGYDVHGPTSPTGRASLARRRSQQVR